MAMLPGNPPRPAPAARPLPTRATHAGGAAKSGPRFKWMLLGGLFFAAFFFVLLAVGLFAGVNKLKDYGYDPELARKYPALTGFIIAIRLNSAVEDLQVDKEHGTATFKDKRSGRRIRVSEIHGALKREYLDHPAENAGSDDSPPPLIEGPPPRLKLPLQKELPEKF